MNHKFRPKSSRREMTDDENDIYTTGLWVGASLGIILGTTLYVFLTWIISLR